MSKTHTPAASDRDLPSQDESVCRVCCHVFSTTQPWVQINHTPSCFYGKLCPNDDKSSMAGGDRWQSPYCVAGDEGCRCVLTANSARHPSTPIRIESHQAPQRSPQVEINLAATLPGPSIAASLPTTAPHLQSGTHPGDESSLITTTHIYLPFCSSTRAPSAPSLALAI